MDSPGKRNYNKLVLPLVAWTSISGATATAVVLSSRYETERAADRVIAVEKLAGDAIDAAMLVTELAEEYGAPDSCRVDAGGCSIGGGSSDDRSKVDLNFDSATQEFSYSGQADREFGEEQVFTEDFEVVVQSDREIKPGTILTLGSFSLAASSEASKSVKVGLSLGASNEEERGLSVTYATKLTPGDDGYVAIGEYGEKTNHESLSKVGDSLTHVQDRVREAGRIN